MKAAVGLIAMWTGQLDANVSHMRDMCIHQMDDKEVDQFAIYVREANYAISALSKYAKECQEKS
jgi:hypothetical protein